MRKGLGRRIALTAFLRSLVRPDKKAYRRAAKEAQTDAVRYAERNCRNYFEFQHIWPQIMDRVDSDKVLTTALVQSALIEPVSQQAREVEKRAVDPGATGQIRLDLAD